MSVRRKCTDDKASRGTPGRSLNRVLDAGANQPVDTLGLPGWSELSRMLPWSPRDSTGPANELAKKLDVVRGMSDDEYTLLRDLLKNVHDEQHPDLKDKYLMKNPVPRSSTVPRNETLPGEYELDPASYVDHTRAPTKLDHEAHKANPAQPVWGR